MLTSTQKKAVVCAAVLLIPLLIAGIVTRTSYNTLSQTKAGIQDALYTTYDFDLEKYDEQNIILEMDSCPYIFEIEVIACKNIYYCTEVTANVTRVVKGGNTFDRQTITIYAPYHFWLKEEENRLYFTTFNTLFNAMQTGNTYLVALEHIDYYPAYQKTQKYETFRVGTELFYSLCTNRQQTTFIEADGVVPYSAIRDLEFFCYTQKQLDSLNQTKNAVLKYYLGATPNE